MEYAGWFYKVGDQVRGPVSPDELRQKVASCEILPRTLIRKGADGAWVHAEKIQGLVGPSGSGTTPTEEPSPSDACDRSAEGDVVDCDRDRRLLWTARYLTRLRLRPRVLVGYLVCLIFVLFVWPTLFRYEKVSASRGGQRLCRINRITGTARYVEIGTSNQEETTLDSKVLGSETISRLSGRARFSGSSLHVDLYNGSDSDITEIVVNLKVKTSFVREAVDRRYDWHAEYTKASQPKQPAKPKAASSPSANFDWEAGYQDLLRRQATVQEPAPQPTQPSGGIDWEAEYQKVLRQQAAVQEPASQPTQPSGGIDWEAGWEKLSQPASSVRETVDRRYRLTLLNVYREGKVVHPLESREFSCDTGLALTANDRWTWQIVGAMGRPAAEMTAWEIVGVFLFLIGFALAVGLIVKWLRGKNLALVDESTTTRDTPCRPQTTID